MAFGPVDVIIIGFPGNKFTGRIAPALMDLVDSGTIRIIDPAKQQCSSVLETEIAFNQKGQKGDSGTNGNRNAMSTAGARPVKRA